MRVTILAAIAAAALGLAGCSSSGDDQQAAAGAGSLSGGSARSVDPASVEYFSVSVGDTVYFSTDQTELSAQAQAVLDRQAAWLQQNASRRIRIEGHADERGTREYNLALGARRANSVQNYLISKGIDRSRIEAVTFGRERPVVTCAQESCWAQNRRAQTVPL